MGNKLDKSIGMGIVLYGCLNPKPKRMAGVRDGREECEQRGGGKEEEGLRVECNGAMVQSVITDPSHTQI